MESDGKHGTHTMRSTRERSWNYQIVVGSELSERYAVAFEGMRMETKGGQTILTGEVKDQSHLHGILERINALGLRLVSIESRPKNTKTTQYITHRPPLGGPQNREDRSPREK
jgi:hypothetical protein